MYVLRWIYGVENLLLNAKWQISKKYCFEKYCSIDKACQFYLYKAYSDNYLAIGGELPFLTIGDEYRNKPVRPFI